MAASNMISSNGLMSLLATRQRPFPALHFTLSRFAFFIFLKKIKNLKQKVPEWKAVVLLPVRQQVV